MREHRSHTVDQQRPQIQIAELADSNQLEAPASSYLSRLRPPKGRKLALRFGNPRIAHHGYRRSNSHGPIAKSFDNGAAGIIMLRPVLYRVVDGCDVRINLLHTYRVPCQCLKNHGRWLIGQP